MPQTIKQLAPLVPISLAINQEGKSTELILKGQEHGVQIQLAT